MTTTTLSIAAIFGSASAVKAGGPTVMIQVTATDANGNPSGARSEVDSSDESICTLTSAEQLGVAPLGLVGQKSGNCVITATAKDGSGKTATLNVTVI